MHNNNKNWKLILASSSPRRKELLGHTKVPFTIQTIATDEVSHEHDPRAFAMDVAKQKGVVVARSLTPAPLVVVSADTVVALDGTIFGKPKDAGDARRILLELSGKKHQVHTAVCIQIFYQNKWHALEHVESTQVEFSKIEPHLLEAYVASNDALDKAGAYGIQGQALTFIERIDGCYANVVGFPLARFCAMMEKQFTHLIGGEGPWQNYFIS